MAVSVVVGFALLASARPAPARPTVSVDMTQLEEPTHKRLGAVELERRAVLRLVQDGFAVVAANSRPDILLRVRASGTTLALVAQVGERELRRSIPVGKVPMAELHLEVAQKMVELAREALLLLPAEALEVPELPQVDAGVSLPTDAGVVAKESPPQVPQPPAFSETRSVELDLGASALWRISPVDAVFRVDFRYSLLPRLRLHFGVALAPFGTPGVHIYEQTLLIGAAYSLYLADPFQLELGLQLGGLLHIYSLDDATLRDPAGIRVDGLLSVPFLLSWRPGGHFTMSVFLAPGAVTRTREHILSGVDVWRRSAFRLEAGGSVGWRF